MAIIGGDIGAMEATAARFDATGSAAAAETTAAAGFARSQQGEYEALARALVGRVREAADACGAEADRMRADLESTEWYGSARAGVERAEAELRTTLRTLLDDTGSMAEQFTADLTRLVAGYTDEVLTGRVAPAMERLREAYAQAGAATRRVAEGFRQADAALGGF